MVDQKKLNINGTEVNVVPLTRDFFSIHYFIEARVIIIYLALGVRVGRLWSRKRL